MSTKLMLEYCIFAEIFVALVTLAVMMRKRLLRNFYALTAFLVVIALGNTVAVVTLYFRKELGISKVLDYEIYQASNWVTSSLEYALMLAVIYGVFRQAMKPLEGLHRAGKVVFRWVSGVSVALVLGMAFGPHASSANYFANVQAQIQQGVSVLTLCLLLFVCLATRYLGLTYRSHIFGASLGLGIWATVSLVETAWYPTSMSQGMYSPVYLMSSLGALAALLTWGTYFTMPEPERKMVLLPTTSPYFLWNRISEALGDDPGFVAIAGFKPEMLAPAEMTMLTESSKRIRQRSALEQEQMDSLLGEGAPQYQSIAMQH